MIGINPKSPAFQSRVLSISQVSFLCNKLKAFSYLFCNMCDFDYRIKAQAIRKAFTLTRKKRKKKKKIEKPVKDHFLLSGRGETLTI